MNQKQGEFTGVFLNANYQKGVFNYSMEDIDEEILLNIMQDVSQNGAYEVERFYQEVIWINKSLN